MIRPTYTDEDGWTFPAWWPKLARDVVETWSSAKRAGDADLFYQQWRDHTEWNVRLITYLTPEHIGLGLDVEWQRRWPRGRGESDGGWLLLAVQLGAASVTLSLHAPDVVTPRRVVSAIWDRTEP